MRLVEEWTGRKSLLVHGIIGGTVLISDDPHEWTGRNLQNVFGSGEGSLPKFLQLT
jgi:hypothetical protein